MTPISRQLRQTVIATGMVGAFFGAIAVAALLAVGPVTSARLLAQGITPPHWSAVAFHLVVLFLSCTAGSIILFGLFPALIGRLIGHAMRRLRTPPRSAPVNDADA